MIAATFDSQGWQYDLATGPQLVEDIREHGGVDGERLARSLPAAFFERNRVPRDLVATVLERALGGRTLSEEDVGMPTTTIVIGGNNYQLTVGAGASVVNSNLNVGDGTQIAASADAAKEEVLLAIEAIIRAGLADDWNEDAARELAKVVDQRSDLDYEDVQTLASEVVRADQPARERVKSFLNRIAASGLGGALATGITAGVGEALTHLPM
jgi:hypothetical protein